jgi:hypothetical protein
VIFDKLFQRLDGRFIIIRPAHWLELLTVNAQRAYTQTQKILFITEYYVIGH